MLICGAFMSMTEHTLKTAPAVPNDGVGMMPSGQSGFDGTAAGAGADSTG